MTDTSHVVIVGGGFAGLSCARRLAKRDDVRVTLLDKNDYHQFRHALPGRDLALASTDIAEPPRQFRSTRT
jgi:NADH dehydrogenase